MRMAGGVGQANDADLLSIEQPDISDYIPPSTIWDPGVLSVLKPFEVTLLPPEQKIFGIGANTVLTAGLAVLGLGIMMAVIKK